MGPLGAIGAPPPPPPLGVKFAMIREGSEAMDGPGGLEANSMHTSAFNLSPIMIRPLLRQSQPSLIQHTQPRPKGANDQLNSSQRPKLTHGEEQTAGQ